MADRIGEIVSKINVGAKEHGEDEWLTNLANDPGKLQDLVEQIVGASKGADVEILVMGGEPVALESNTGMGGRDVSTLKTINFSQGGAVTPEDISSMRELVIALAQTGTVPAIHLPAQHAVTILGNSSATDGQRRSLEGIKATHIQQGRQYTTEELAEVEGLEMLDDALTVAEEVPEVTSTSTSASAEKQNPAIRTSDAASTVFPGVSKNPKNTAEKREQFIRQVNEMHAQHVQKEKKADAESRKEQRQVDRDAIKREGQVKEIRTAEEMKQEKEEQQLFNRIETKEVKAEAREDKRELVEENVKELKENDAETRADRTMDDWQEGRGPHKGQAK